MDHNAALKLLASMSYWDGRIMDGLAMNSDDGIRIATDAADILQAKAVKLHALLKKADDERKAAQSVTATRAMFRAGVEEAVKQSSECGRYRG